MSIENENVVGIIRQGINMAGFTNIGDIADTSSDLFKSDLHYAFAYSENVKFKKSGKEIIEMLKAKCTQYETALTTVAQKMVGMRAVLEEKGFDFQSDGYCNYNYKDTADDVKKYISKYHDCMYLYKDLKKDCDTCKILMTDGIDEKKSYDLTFKQVQALSANANAYTNQMARLEAQPIANESEDTKVSMYKAEEMEEILEKGGKAGGKKFLKTIRDKNGKTMRVWTKVGGDEPAAKKSPKGDNRGVKADREKNFVVGTDVRAEYPFKQDGSRTKPSVDGKVTKVISDEKGSERYEVTDSSGTKHTIWEKDLFKRTKSAADKMVDRAVANNPDKPKASSERHQEMSDMMGGKDRKAVKGKVGTFLQKKDGGSIAVEYRGTEVARVSPNGDTWINSGGWMTNTTKARINENTDVKVNQKAGKWFVTANGKTHDFKDGMTITASGEVKGAEPKKGSKSKEASAVLQLLDGDEEISYEKALAKVLKANPKVDKKTLEKELDKYI